MWIFSVQDRKLWAFTMLLGEAVSINIVLNFSHVDAAICLLCHTLNSVTFDHYTLRCGMRSLPRASSNDHCWERTPDPLINVIGSDAFTN